MKANIPKGLGGPANMRGNDPSGAEDAGADDRAAERA